ncbi:MAG: ECF transporter S component [Eubacterium sp.]|jgi:riboflavin transporter FmnP|nr:ECF transporter S component [Eubacterium sp.]
MKKTQTKTRLLAGCGMLSAAAIALQYLEFPLAFILPSFIKLDFSDLPALLGAFAYGPVAGIIIELVKNLIHMAVSQSGYIGELSNFILGAVFTFVAGVVYKKYNNKKGALLGGIIGSVCMAVISFPSNLFVVYPFYYNFMDKAAVLGMYQAILPGVKSIEEALLIFNVPFTLVKGLLCVLISMLIYKPLSPILHGKDKL